MVTMAWNSPAWAFRKMVSAGNGPCTGKPSWFSSRTAGAMMSTSSRPQVPPSPPCGLKAATATRGSGTPLACKARWISRAASLMPATLSAAAASFSGMCEDTREVHRSPSVLNSQKYPVTPRYWAK